MRKKCDGERRRPLIGRGAQSFALSLPPPLGVDADGPFFGVVSGRGENSEATEDAPGLRTGVCALLIVGGERSGRASKHRAHAVGGLVPDGLSQISMLSIAALVLSYSITPRAGPISMSSSVAFSKYHGLGNDFVLVDCREAERRRLLRRRRPRCAIAILASARTA